MKLGRSAIYPKQIKPETIPSQEAHRGPAISVVMPAYNAFRFLNESIASILNQSFSDFEFIILDDGSTDGSAELLVGWAAQDSRIRLLANRQTSGLVRSSNLLLANARAPLVARMDADDIAHPDRLRRQLALMESEPSVVLVGTLADGIDSNGRRVRPRDRSRLIWRSPFPPFPHGSVMFRRKVFENVGGYSDHANGWEDHELFLRMSTQGKIAVVPQVLYSLRYHSESATLSFSPDEAGRIAELRSRCLTEFRAGRDYRVLLDAPANHPVSARSNLAALYLRAAMRFWAGESEDFLATLLNAHGGWNLNRVGLVIWAAWARESPRSLRMLLRSRIRIRDFLAGFLIKDGRAYEWRFE
jgi:glycosyltransferase involved in cell wall biosynthesis